MEPAGLSLPKMYREMFHQVWTEYSTGKAHTGKAWRFVPFPSVCCPFLGLTAHCVDCQSTTVSSLFQSGSSKFPSLHSACLLTYNAMFGVRNLIYLFCLCLNSVKTWADSKPWRVWGFRNARDHHGLITQFIIWLQNSIGHPRMFFSVFMGGWGSCLINVGRKWNWILEKTLTRPGSSITYLWNFPLGMDTICFSEMTSHYQINMHF